jgi:hypothetical protein
MEKPVVTNLFLYSIMGGLIVVGTAGTIIGKYLDLTAAPSSDSGCYYFAHPYLQTYFMFLGELLCFPMLWIKLYFDKR